MSALKKLMQARIALQGKDLKKSGENKFAKYKYFELGDFIPQTMQIFASLDLASVVSFTDTIATLTITDCEDSTSVVITSPVAAADLKGAHAIQNLGAAQSYLRRYLWLAAMEIVEHDAIDSSEPKTKSKPPSVFGEPGGWQLGVTLKPDGELSDWIMAIDAASTLALGMAESSDDVMAIFKRNKVLWDEVKKQDPDAFKDMMAKFTNAKQKFGD
jgi:hypothetical protein